MDHYELPTEELRAAEDERIRKLEAEKAQAGEPVVEETAKQRAERIASADALVS